MIRRFPAPLALSAALALTLSACGQEASSDPVAEARPAYANAEGPAGAEQFASYWVQQINDATETGETKELRSLGLDSCGACSDFPQQLEDIYEAGGRVESEDWELEQVVREGGATAEQVGMLLTVKVPPQKVYAGDAAKPQKYRGGEQRFRMIVVRKDAHWMISELTPR